MATEARLRANARYAKSKLKQFKVAYHIEHDADIITRLAACKNVSGYLKELIRADIEARPDLFA